ncbi:hypothetical protein Ancab_034277 [Ancistrocladus abbreviatus]
MEAKNFVEFNMDFVKDKDKKVKKEVGKRSPTKETSHPRARMQRNPMMVVATRGAQLFLVEQAHHVKGCPQLKLSMLLPSQDDRYETEACMGSMWLLNSMKGKVTKVPPKEKPSIGLMFVNAQVNKKSTKVIEHLWMNAMNSSIPILGIAQKVPTCLSEWSRKVDIIMVTTNGFNLALGMDFLNTIKPFSMHSSKVVDKWFRLYSTIKVPQGAPVFFEMKDDRLAEYA